MRKRIPRVRRWEYLKSVLVSAKNKEDKRELELRLIENKREFERMKSLAIGSGSLSKKGLKTAKELLRDSRLMTVHLGWLQDQEKMELTKIGEKIISINILTKEFLNLVFPRLLLEYKPIQELLFVLKESSNLEIRLPQRRDIINFSLYSDAQNLDIGQTDFMISRDLLGQLGVVNWFLYDKGQDRFCCTYLSSMILQNRKTETETDIDIVIKDELQSPKLNEIKLSGFLPILWLEYINLAKGIPLKPVYYSHLRDLVCYKARVSDMVFDKHMSSLIQNQGTEQYLIFGSGGTLPYSHYRSSALKSLPMKSSTGRYIIYIKMDEKK